MIYCEIVWLIQQTELKFYEWREFTGSQWFMAKVLKMVHIFRKKKSSVRKKCLMAFKFYQRRFRINAMTDLFQQWLQIVKLVFPKSTLKNVFYSLIQSEAQFMYNMICNKFKRASKNTSDTKYKVHCTIILFKPQKRFNLVSYFK